MQDYFVGSPVIFLEYPDFDEEGKFIHEMYGMDMVVMVGGSFCGHCKKTAPAFNEFAQLLKDKIIIAVIQVDGSDSEKALGQKVGKMANIRGVPSFLMFDSSGKFVKTHDGERTVEGFMNFVDKK